MLKTVLMCKGCAVCKSASQLFFTKPFQRRRKYFAPHLRLASVTITKVTIYKNCINIPVSWGHSLFAGAMCLPWHHIISTGI